MPSRHAHTATNAGGAVQPQEQLQERLQHPGAVWARYLQRPQIAALKGQYSVDYGLQMSGLVLAVIPVIIVYIIFQEQFIKGATAGAVKE